MKQAIDKHIKKKEQMIEDELKKNAKHNAAVLNKKAQEEVEAMTAGRSKTAGLNEGESLSHEESRAQMEALQPNSHTAVFSDRTEYLHADGTKVIDKGNHIDIEAGKWMTQAAAAALVVDAAVAKGWTSIEFTGSDEFKEYGEAIARARGIELKTAEVVLDSRQVDTDFGGQHQDQEIQTENHFEPLADQSADQSQEVEQGQSQTQTQNKQQEELEL